MSAHTAEQRSHHGCCADKACTNATCMALPKGKTCGQCVHEYRCCLMFGHKPTDTYCDWFPRRFHERAAITEATPSAPTAQQVQGMDSTMGALS